jgi:hypothetical protein
MRGGEVPRKRCEMSPSNRAVAPEFGCVKPGPRVPNSGGAIENKGGEKKKKKKKETKKIQGQSRTSLEI